MTNPRYCAGIIGIVVLHWLVLVLFAANIIPQQTKKPDRIYWFHQGGDNHGYYAQARALYTGRFQPNKYPLGFPILLLPALWLNPNWTHDELVEPIAFFWSALMFPIGIVLLIWLAQKFTQRRGLALSAGLLYTLLPLLWLALFNATWDAEMAEIVAIHTTWAQMLSDGPTAFFTLLAVVLFVLARERDYPLPLVAVLGVVLGFLGLLRFSGLLIALVLGGLFLFERRWRELTLLGMLALLTFAPQLIYNQVFFGNPLETGYTHLDELKEHGLFNIRYLFDPLAKAWGRFGLLGPLAGGIAIGVFGGTLYRLWLRDSVSALLIGGWIVSYSLFYSVYSHSWYAGILRFMIPAYPALVLLAIVFWDELVRSLRGFRDAPAPAPGQPL